MHSHKWRVNYWECSSVLNFNSLNRLRQLKLVGLITRCFVHQAMNCTDSFSFSLLAMRNEQINYSFNQGEASMWCENVYRRNSWNLWSLSQTDAILRHVWVNSQTEPSDQRWNHTYLILVVWSTNGIRGESTSLGRLAPCLLLLRSHIGTVYHSTGTRKGRQLRWRKDERKWEKEGDLLLNGLNEGWRMIGWRGRVGGGGGKDRREEEGQREIMKSRMAPNLSRLQDIWMSERERERGENIRR